MSLSPTEKMKIIILSFSLSIPICWHDSKEFCCGKTDIGSWLLLETNKKRENHLDCALSANKNWLCFGYYDNPCKSQINHMFDYSPFSFKTHDPRRFKFCYFHTEKCNSFYFRIFKNNNEEFIVDFEKSMSTWFKI